MTHKHKFSTGDVFAVSTGKFLGEFFVYIKSCSKTKCFLSLPKMIIREIDDEKIDQALDNNILEFQERLPRDVRRVCIKQYEQNEKTIHRRK